MKANLIMLQPPFNVTLYYIIGTEIITLLGSYYIIRFYLQWTQVQIFITLLGILHYRKFITLSGSTVPLIHSCLEIHSYFLYNMNVFIVRCDAY